MPGASRGGTGTGALVFSITGAAPKQPATGHLTVTVTGSTPLKEPPSACCTGAPPVLEFDQAGNLVGHWGGPGAGYEWPTANHGITVDYKDNVWIGGNDPKDAHVLKFTRDGKFLLQVGHPGKNAGSNDTENFWRAAKVIVDPKTNEAYVADGYGNRRVAVIDADTGKFKRYWGAYGNKPDDAPWARTIRTRRRPASSAARSTARRCRTTGSSTCATAPTTGSRSSSATARS